MPIKKLRPSFAFTEDRLAQLKAIVPEAFADGKINWEALKQALGEFLEDESPEAEHFGLFWPGKREARRLATLPSKGTLVPAAGEGVDEDKTRNIFIEGENLEVLKLLQKSYAGRIKMIYIDPPYNTGNDFVYKDDFKEPLEEYLKRTGQADENGKLLTTNTKASGRFHSNWLNLIYPRLLLARSLLSENGVIFTSIDDNELHNLRQMMDEILGEGNFLACLARRVKSGGGSAAHHFAVEHDYVVVYAKNKESTGPLFIPHDPEYAKRYSEEDHLGRYFWDTMVRSYTQTKPYKIEAPDGTILQGKLFRSENRFKDDLKSGEVRFLKKDDGTWSVQFKQRMADGRKIRSLLHENEFRSSHDEIDELGLGDTFQFPKPVYLLRQLIQASSESNDIVIDFFAGSCTTAQAILDLNREDGGNRRFIMVQLPEPTPEDSPARKAGYNTIAEIGKERIRRVTAKMRKESNGKSSSKRETPEDLGFKVFKLACSNFRAWQDYNGENIQELEMLFDQAETPLVKGWKEDDLLTEIMLQQGFPLDSKITRQTGFKSNKVKLIESEACAHRLFVCLDPKIKEDAIKHLELRIEDIFVCLDSALTDQARMRLADVCRLNIT
ncbi:site-specific DNA-methyltransferase [candidate division KSB1 bacterium]|nr:site-specific DNA-methyltransferase [bacterium]NUM66951.1 site-specific DNA-methyltransferase [candidate division KSB1 bacterium]